MTYKYVASPSVYSARYVMTSLTAVAFIFTVQAVALEVTDPRLVDALAVFTLESTAIAAHSATCRDVRSCYMTFRPFTSQRDVSRANSRTCAPTEAKPVSTNTIVYLNLVYMLRGLWITAVRHAHPSCTFVTEYTTFTETCSTGALITITQFRLVEFESYKRNFWIFPSRKSSQASVYNTRTCSRRQWQSFITLAISSAGPQFNLYYQVLCIADTLKCYK